MNKPTVILTYFLFKYQKKHTLNFSAQKKAASTF
jgi:hypothetical protein